MGNFSSHLLEVGGTSHTSKSKTITTIHTVLGSMGKIEQRSNNNSLILHPTIIGHRSSVTGHRSSDIREPRAEQLQ